MPKGRTAIMHQVVTLAIAALGANSAFTAQTKIDASRLQGLKIRKLKYAITYYGKTANEGPISFGLAAGISDTEIAECIQADPQRHDDPGASEEANRRVYPLGFIPYVATGTAPTSQPDQNRLREAKDFPSWVIPEGTGLQAWAYNHSGSVLTTGTSIQIFLTIIGEWEVD